MEAAAEDVEDTAGMAAEAAGGTAEGEAVEGAADTIAIVRISGSCC